MQVQIQAGDEIVDWLLDSETPSLRYLTRRLILGQDEAVAQVQAEWAAMHASGPIPDILTQQTPAGHWLGEHSYYSPKYVSTHWSMLLLTELGVDGTLPKFRQGVEFMLEATEQKLNNKFDTGEQGLSCFYGNLLRYAVHGGFLADPRVTRIVEYLLRDAQEFGWCCPINADLACAWGAGRALFGLASIPPEQRTPEVQHAIASGLDLLLDDYRLVSANYPTPGTVHKMWHKLNFPLFYQTDILFILSVLAELDALAHPNAQAGVGWLLEQRKTNGRWRGTSPFRGRTWKNLLGAQDVDRWVTLHSLQIITKAAQT